MKTIARIFSALTLLILTLAAAPLAIQFGYDASSNSVCAYDRSTPIPTCAPMGLVDSVNHVVYARTGVDTKAALAAVGVNASYAGFTLRRHGYYSAGDGGAADYTYSTAACPLNSGAGDGGYQIPPASGAGCWQAALPAGGISAKVWGAKCDNNNATDDAAALNAAFSTATAIGAFKLNVPAGTCSFKSSLLIGTVTANPGTVIAGASHGGTRLLYTGAATTGKLVQVGSDSATPFVPLIQDLAIQSATKMTQGACFYVEHMRFGRIERVFVDAYADAYNNCWDGIVIDQPDFLTVDGYLAVAQNDAVQTTGKGIGTGYQYDLWMEHGKIGGSANGLHITGGLDNLYFDASMVSVNGNNVTIDNTGGYNNPTCSTSCVPAATYKNQEITFGSKFVTDQATKSNYLINDTTCDTVNYGWIHISGPITNAQTFDGVAVANWPNCMLVIDSPTITQNNRNGILVSDAAAYVTIGAQTFIAQNRNLGIDASSAWSRLLSFPAASIVGNGSRTGSLSSYANALGQYVQVTANGWSATPPGIGSGFNAGAAISQANGTRTFVVSVGSSGTASTGTISMPPALNGWSCTVIEAASSNRTVQSGNTPNTVSFTYETTSAVPTAWPAPYSFSASCLPR